MNGKGSKDTRSPDYDARRDSWDRIFGKNKDSCKEECDLVESDKTEDDKENDTDRPS